MTTLQPGDKGITRHDEDGSSNIGNGALSRTWLEAFAEWSAYQCIGRLQTLDPAKNLQVWLGVLAGKRWLRSINRWRWLLALSRRDVVHELAQLATCMALNGLLSNGSRKPRKRLDRGCQAKPGVPGMEGNGANVVQSTPSIVLESVE
jgi:hypothetical protein